ncbi:LLM class flavin-dependent oxidoreductase [Paenibacillus sp. 23TSA30-6]|uniref:LLM class flavin-dependent oxidoreductase n=1 Tax=Paenibacillus sp. 23TSA30-6 TaxID=2546104 RepID=UPI0017879E22|nr:LLM class flavin-dependent oxidoreductase [Paenibacillus sp. 23TSA30-6]MBE0337713.1 LLM class flavin-dependent oxidoreductase [Paenibacillus sp. 23TSA30-6]
MLKLGILDQSHIPEGGTAQDALSHTTALAREADKLGYSRYWVSEHHASKMLAHSSPEVLIAHLAANTSRIRVGSGGIMLPHYSAYKVAENFRLLEALHPGRIDLGLGRAPGGLPLATRALQEGKYQSVEQYPQQILDIIDYFHDSVPADHRFAGLHAAPTISTIPELWLLGSSGESARLAAMMGASYAFAQFFGTPGGVEATARYHDQYQPSILGDKPRSMAAVTVSCAETTEEAEQLASSASLFFLLLMQGKEMTSLPSVKTALSYPYTEFDRERLRQSASWRVVGTPDQCKEQLLRLAEQYRTDELLVVSSIHDFDKRVQSYRLLAKAFDLA